MNAMVHLEGSSPNCDSLRDKIYDEAIDDIPEIVEVRRRAPACTDVMKLNENREREQAQRALWIGDRNKKNNDANGQHKKYAECTHEEKKSRVWHCINCNKRHKGGEDYCSKPCKHCTYHGKHENAKKHKRFHCPLKSKSGRKRKMRAEKKNMGKLAKEKWNAKKWTLEEFGLMAANHTACEACTIMDAIQCTLGLWG